MGRTRLRGDAQIIPDTVGTIAVKDGSLTADDLSLAPGTVDGVSLADESVTAAKLNANVAGIGLSLNVTTNAIDLDNVVLSTTDLTDVDAAVNLADGLVKLDALGKLPVLDGSQLTDLPTSTGDLRADGTVPLTADWDVGSFTITAGAFIGDGSGLTGIGAGSNFVDIITPSGLVNGVNKVFTLSTTPVAGSVHLYFNGLLLTPGAGNDYTILGVTMTMVDAPNTGSSIRASYRT